MAKLRYNGDRLEDGGGLNLTWPDLQAGSAEIGLEIDADAGGAVRGGEAATIGLALDINAAAATGVAQGEAAQSGLAIGIEAERARYATRRMIIGARGLGCGMRVSAEGLGCGMQVQVLRAGHGMTVRARSV